MSLISNATSSLVNASVPNDISVRCDGNEYGHKPDIDDCASILRRHIVGREQFKFGQRGSISAEKFVSLPYRLMGDKARCYVEPVLLNEAEFGRASLNQIRDATSELVMKCASSAEQGGIATNFGGDNNLGLILSKYDPEIECRGSFLNWKSCMNVMAEMPASKVPLAFGPAADAGAQVIVPHYIVSDDGDCLARIWYTKKESDKASWFKMWEAITAVYSVCVRNQRSGTIKRLGDHGNLFLTMTPKIGPLGNISLNDTTNIGTDQSVSDF